jgi:hypothetical protein
MIENGRPRISGAAILRSIFALGHAASVRQALIWSLLGWILTKPLSRQVELFELLRGGSDLIIQSSKTQPVLILRVRIVNRSAGLLQLRLAEFHNRAES